MSDASDDSLRKLREIYVDDYKSNLEVEDDGGLGPVGGLVPSSKDLVWVLGKCYYYNYDTINNYSLFI